MGVSTVSECTLASVSATECQHRTHTGPKDVPPNGPDLAWPPFLGDAVSMTGAETVSAAWEPWLWSRPPVSLVFCIRKALILGLLSVKSPSGTLLLSPPGISFSETPDP